MFGLALTLFGMVCIYYGIIKPYTSKRLSEIEKDMEEKKDEI